MPAHLPAPARSTALLAILSLAGTTFALLQAIVVPALPAIEHALGTGPTGAAWILTANLLSTAVLTPVLGRAGDIHGKDRVLTAVLLVLGGGTLVCATAQSLPMMLAGRALQGTGGAVYPLAFGIVRDELPSTRVAGAIGLVSSLLGIGAGLGLAVAGPVVAALSYHWLFWLPLAVLAPTTALAHRFVPRSAVRTPGTVNQTATGLMAAGLVAVLVAVSMTPQWGWTSLRTLGLAALGAVLVAGWIRLELRAREPLVDMRMMRDRAVWATNLAAFLLGFGMYAVIVLVPELVELPRGSGVGLGASVTVAGAFMLPTAVPQLVVGPLSGAIERRIGSRAQLQLGLLLILAGYAGLAIAHAAAGELLVSTAAIGVGLGLGLGALGNLIVSSVDHSQTGVATGMNAVLRTLGGAVGSQVVASVVLGSRGIPTGGGFALAFLACAIAAGLGLAAAAAIPGTRRRRPTEPVAQGA
ncbi:MAG: MFS transporter [Solirubrobacteraceae bacterium]